MDRRERDRLRNEVDKGMLDVGIRSVEEGAYEKESRLPLVKGGTIGFAIGGSAAAFYGNSVGFSSPLGLFIDDYVLVMFGMMFGAMALGALLGWLYGRVATRRN